MGRGVDIEEVSRKVPKRASLKQSLRPQVGNVSSSDLMLREKRRKWEGSLEVLQGEDAHQDLRGQHLLEERRELLEQGKALRETRDLSRANAGSGTGVVDRLAQDRYQSMAVFIEDLEQWKIKDAGLRNRRSQLRAQDKQLNYEEKKRFGKRTGISMTFPQKLLAADKAALVKMKSLFSAKRSSAGSAFERARMSMLQSAPAKVDKTIESVFDEFFDILWEHWPPIDPTRY